MWSEKQVSFVVNALTDEQRDFLMQEGNSLYDLTLELITIGRNYSDIDEQLEFNYENLISKYGNLINGDFLKIDALICFNLAFEREVKPRINRRKVLTAGTVVFAEYLFRKKPVNSTVNEEEINHRLSLAYEYRLQCDFNRCHRILNEIERALNGRHTPVARKLLAMAYDLRIEAYHTASQKRFQKAASQTSTESIKMWFEIRGTTELIHAFLRDAILYRQEYYFNYSAENLFSVVKTLADAEDYGIIRTAELIGTKDSFTNESICKFYTDTIKAYSQILDFNSAKKYIEKAEKKCFEVGGFGSRNWLDLVRAKSVFISEKLYDKPYPRDFILLDDTIEQMKTAIKISKKNHPEDLVLHQVLERDLIPLLLITQTSAYKQEAEYYFKKCFETAKSLNLHHEMRVMQDIKSRFRVI